MSAVRPVSLLGPGGCNGALKHEKPLGAGPGGGAFLLAILCCLWEKPVASKSLGTLHPIHLVGCPGTSPLTLRTIPPFQPQTSQTGMYSKGTRDLGKVQILIQWVRAEADCLIPNRPVEVGAVGLGSILWAERV